MSDLDEIRGKIFEAIGEASMCWIPPPEGVFDSTLALDVGNRLAGELEPLFAELEAARELYKQANIRHPGENNPLAKAMRDYFEVINAKG